MENKDQIVHEFKDNDNKQFFNIKLTLILILIVIIGIATGFIASNTTAPKSADMNLSPKNSSEIQKGTVYGSDDSSIFKDSTEGVLKEGGIDGEGQYHLERPGGKSQNAYLTSSVIDLSVFVGKKIKVWGETQKAQKAGWLMDVGKVEVLK